MPGSDVRSGSTAVNLAATKAPTAQPLAAPAAQRPGKSAAPAGDVLGAASSSALFILGAGFAALALCCLAGCVVARRRRQDRRAFGASLEYVVEMRGKHDGEADLAMSYMHSLHLGSGEAKVWVASGSLDFAFPL